MPNFVLRERPDQIPQKCSSCGANDRNREYLDLDVSVDRYGRIYLCSSCIKTITKICGYVPARELSVAKKKADIFKEKYVDATVKIVELENDLDTIRRVIAVNSNISSSVHMDNTKSAETERPDHPKPVKSNPSRRLGSVSAFGDIKLD